MKPSSKKPSHTFTGYEKLVIAIIAFIQFTVILDFMVISPLNPMLKPALGINPDEFGKIVASYAISAGIAGILAAGFSDKFDRKKMLLLFYSGFVIGTFFCGISNTYPTLLASRIFTGIFGGVIGSIGFAIITDIFKMEVRGRVMGFVQMAFSASQVLGIPAGLYLANSFDWHAPFLMIVGVAIPVGILMLMKLKPVTGHLSGRVDKKAFHHLLHTAKNPAYQRGFIATMLLATGGFMMMPFSSDFLVNNIKIDKANLPMIFMITGVFSLITGPLIGQLSDKIGKFYLFLGGTILSIITILIYTNLGPNAIWVVIVINTVMWVGISSRMISASALTSGVPEMKDRGAYMGINSSIQQISGGIGSFVAGKIVVQSTPGTPIQHFEIVGYVVIASMLFTIVMMRVIEKQVAKKMHAAHV